MKRTLPALIIVFTLAAPVMAAENGPAAAKSGPLGAFAAADAVTPPDVAVPQPSIPAAVDPSGPRLQQRPSALGPLYVSLAALNALDVYSTSRALSNGARELNPVMASTRGSSAAGLAIKAATTTSSIFLAEKLWKKNRAAAIVTMVAVNGFTAAVVARNFRNAR